MNAPQPELQVEYLITYTFHLDPIRAKLINLPEKMYETRHVATDGTKDALVAAVNNESVAFLSYPNGFPKKGLSLRLDVTKMEDPKKIDTDRAFVFHHMICAITSSYKRLTGQTPTMEDAVTN